MDHYAVVGNPIAHSKSPQIHQQFAKQTKQAMVYDKLLFPLDEFSSCAKAFFANGGKGLNITVPFKEDAFNFASQLTQRAQLAGAVNTLIAQDDGVILGDTTDGVGLVNDIKNLNWLIENKRVLVLGAGGAVRGVLHPLLEQKPQKLIIANRTASKALELAEIFSDFGNICGSGFEQMKDRPFDIVINGTSASLSGDLPPIPTTVFTHATCVYDMVYGAEPTAFMTWAKACGAEQVVDGLGMLVGQAAESFRLWRSVEPHTDKVVATLREQMKAA